MTKKQQEHKLSINEVSVTERESGVTTLYSTQITEGPLPHPEILNAYNNIISDGAERIMSMAEKEQSHRFEMDLFNTEQMSNINEHEIKLQNRGQTFAFIIAIILILSCIAMVLIGHETIAYIFFGGGAVMLCALFLAKNKIMK